MKDAAALLDQTLQEEKKIDALLSRLAQAKVNLKAAWGFRNPQIANWAAAARPFQLIFERRLVALDEIAA